MSLLSPVFPRLPLHDHVMAGSTSVVAGLVNVCSVMAFFAFASNVTGHVAVFAEELVNGHFHQVLVLVVWLMLFVAGAGISGHLIHQGRMDPRRVLLSLAPLLLEACLLLFVGFYGLRLYEETLRETECLVGVLLFAMGLQNGMVASISKGAVKTTHLTGLLTDLGVEIALLLDRKQRQDENLRFKFALHVLTLGGYVVGGIVGGLLFQRIGFGAFYVGGGVLALVFLKDAYARRALALERLRPAERETTTAGRLSAT